MAAVFCARTLRRGGPQAKSESKDRAEILMGCPRTGLWTETDNCVGTGGVRIAVLAGL